MSKVGAKYEMVEIIYGSLRAFRKGDLIFINNRLKRFTREVSFAIAQVEKRDGITLGRPTITRERFASDLGFVATAKVVAVKAAQEEAKI